MLFEYIQVRTLQNRIRVRPDVPPKSLPKHFGFAVLKAASISQEVVEDGGEFNWGICGVNVGRQDHDNFVADAGDIGSIAEDLLK